MMKTAIAGLLSTLVFCAVAVAEGVSIYAPVQPQYKLGDFDYRAPSADGWRQVTSAPDSFVLVYAESVTAEQVNTRVQVEAQAFAVPDPKIVQDVMWLTEQGQSQQVKERGDQLVAFSKIAAVASNEKVMSYSLVTHIGDQDMYEIFYTIVAPDKTSYLVAKLTTKEPDHREQIYFSQFEASLASLAHNPASLPDSDKGSSPGASTSPKGT